MFTGCDSSISDYNYLIAAQRNQSNSKSTPMRKISLIFSIICFLEVVILFLHYRHNRTHRGFDWWASAIFLISLYFLTFFLPVFESLGIVQNIIRNTILVASFLMIYIGTLRFYNKTQVRQNILFFSAGCIITCQHFFKVTR